MRAAAVALIAVLPDDSVNLALRSLEALLYETPADASFSFEEFLEHSPPLAAIGSANLTLKRAPEPVLEWDY